MSNATPKHVAMIMDGNGRWALANHCRHRWDGHRYGVRAVDMTVKACLSKGIPTLTLFAFSQENNKRSVYEIKALLRLFNDTLDRELPRLQAQGIQLNVVGDVEALSPALARKAQQVMMKTSQGKRLRLNLLINYSGRWHIAETVKRLQQQAVSDNVTNPVFDIEVIEEAIKADLGSDPDLLIRTGGEYRISNCLLWQLAYTELYFESRLWPDYDLMCFEQALNAYAKRERRYGREHHARVG